MRRAKERFDGGHNIFFLRQMTLSLLDENGVADSVQRIEAMGWRLRQMSAHVTSNGISGNSEVLCLLFDRSPTYR